MKKTSLFMGTLILCLAIFSFMTSAQAATKIQLASAYEPTHICAKTAEKFKTLLEKGSNGELVVELFLAGVMGSEEEITESVSIGAVQMQSGGGLPIKTFAPKYYFLDSPYVIRDWAHYQKVFWDSPLGEAARKEIAEKGNTMYLGVVYRGMRQFTSNKPIITPKDLEGIKLRLPQLPTWIAVWKAVGALPVPVALTELFSALQTGVADASEGDVSQIHSFHLDEVQKYLSMTNHLVQTGALTINKKFYESLSQQQQELITKVAKEACAWGSEQILSGEKDLIADLEKKGMQVVIPEADAFREKAKPAVEELFKTQWPVTTWKEVLSY